MNPPEKQILRARMRKTVDAFADKAAASEKIAALLRATLQWQAARVVYGFSPLLSEPDWIVHSGDDGKVFAFPKVEENGMRFFTGGKMVAGVFKVLEPDTGEAAPPPDLVLVPGLAFDKTGLRLGRGGGYFDRWLAANPGVKTLGLCFACQLVKKIPVEAHDIRVDAVLTEKGITST